MSGLATLRDYIRWAISRFNQAQLFFQHDGEGVFEEARALVLGSLHLPYEMHDKYLDCNLHSDEHVLVQDVLKKNALNNVFLPLTYWGKRGLQACCLKLMSA